MTETSFDSSENQARQVDAAIQKAKEIAYQNPGQAAQLLEQASYLAQTGEFAEEPYKAGLAASLAALARLNMESRPDLSARHCLHVLSLLEGQPVIPSLIETKNSLGWIYFHLGDYSTAMDWAHQSFHHSQELSLPFHEASALDLIANIHSMLNEFAQALQAHEAALKIARVNQYRRQEANYLNNLAMTQMEMGNYAVAREASLKCLQMFQEMDSVLDIANSYDTLAQINLGMGDFQQAEANLLNGLKIIGSQENQVLKTYLLKSLGRVYLAQADLSQAVEQAERALAIAQQNGLRGELVGCHQLLAEIYEKHADFPKALQHFKKFHEVTQEIAGDAARKRLSVLNVIHSVENAQHEAEIYRLRNIELQSEVDERKRIQTALEELATRDPLTGLLNRRYFLEKSEQEYARAVRYQHAMAVIMLDLDLFKTVNDTYGHPVGDRVLAMFAERLRDLTRTVDIAGRMGGEEFALVFPETSLSGAVQAAERLCKSFSDEPFRFNTFTIRVTLSAGLTCYLPAEPGALPPFDTLLQRADQALYLAKNAGRNQVQVFSPIPS